MNLGQLVLVWSLVLDSVCSRANVLGMVLLFYMRVHGDGVRVHGVDMLNTIINAINLMIWAHNNIVALLRVMNCWFLRMSDSLMLLCAIRFFILWDTVHDRLVKG